MSVHLSVCPSVRLCVSQSVCLSVCPSVCQSISLSVHPSVSQSVCLSVCLSVCPSICLSINQSVCLSVSRSTNTAIGLLPISSIISKETTKIRAAPHVCCILAGLFLTPLKNGFALSPSFTPSSPETDSSSTSFPLLKMSVFNFA